FLMKRRASAMITSRLTRRFRRAYAARQRRNDCFGASMMTLIRNARLSSGHAKPATPEEESMHAMALKTKRWTLAEVHSLPDDGNKYELIDGELFVTPAPAPIHERILERLTFVLDPYVRANGLGAVYHPRSVVQFRRSEAEPDLMI